MSDKQIVAGAGQGRCCRCRCYRSLHRSLGRIGEADNRQSGTQFFISDDLRAIHDRNSAGIDGHSRSKVGHVGGFAATY